MVFLLIEVYACSCDLDTSFVDAEELISLLFFINANGSFFAYASLLCSRSSLLLFLGYVLFLLLFSLQSNGFSDDLFLLHSRSLLLFTCEHSLHGSE
jgi:hypothetical protein